MNIVHVKTDQVIKNVIMFQNGNHFLKNNDHITLSLSSRYDHVISSTLTLV